MSQPPSDDLIRAYATLEALRASVPAERTIVMGSTIRRYSQALDRVGAAIGRDLSEFQVPSEDMHPTLSGKDTETMSDHYRERIDGALNYIRLLMPPEAVQRIGFRT